MAGKPGTHSDSVWLLWGLASLLVSKTAPALLSVWRLALPLVSVMGLASLAVSPSP